MSIKSIFGVVTGFLSHHIADLSAVGNALSGIAEALPLNRGDKDAIKAAVARVEQSAENIARAVAAFESGETPVTEVHISEADIRSAVAAVVAEQLPALVAAEVARATKATKATKATAKAAK